MNAISKQPSTVLDDDKCYFSSGTEWQTEMVYAMSLDCIFRDGTVIKSRRNQLGLVCAVPWASRCAEHLLGQITEGNSFL